MLKWDSYDASGARGRVVIFPGSQDGPSKECKFLSRKAFEAQWGYGTPGETLVIVEEGELELPETSLWGLRVAFELYPLRRQMKRYIRIRYQ